MTDEQQQWQRAIETALDYQRRNMAARVIVDYPVILAVNRQLQDDTLEVARLREVISVLGGSPAGMLTYCQAHSLPSAGFDWPVDAWRKEIANAALADQATGREEES